MNDQITILVVDPRPTAARKRFCLTLEREGLRVLATRTMYEALDRIERLDIDVLIAPLIGERIDGLKLLEAAYDQNPDVGVIFTTAPNVLENRSGCQSYDPHGGELFSA